MYRLWLHSLLAAVLCLLGSRAALAQLLSPGPLAGAHASLEGDENCTRCHTSGRGTSNGLCNNCHGNVTKQGMHARAFSGACARCHSDHRGRGFAMVRFSPNGFDHGQTGWPLRGAHGQTKCNKCHKSRSWIGVATACTACHKDPHDKRFGLNCLGCHNESNWKTVNLKQFNHNQSRFPLRGAHASAPCGNCHGSPARYRGLDFGNCTSCHKDPHGGRFSSTCTNCHNENSWHQISMKAGAHPGLSLANGHSRVNCRKCHDKGIYAPPTRGRACVNCHKPVHEADFGKSCHKCHASIKWLGLPRKTGLRAHDKTPFSLHGKHVDVACTGCHSPQKTTQQRFRELSFAKCRDCHQDAHGGEFAKRDGGECGGCHSDSGFRPSQFGIRAHASTGFALDGKHTAVPCSSCHTNSPKDGKRLDWRGAKRVCETCHENPHGTQFAKEMKQGGCKNCHSPLGWHSPRIDHRSWPLTGAHASAPCARCHTPTEADRKSGKGASYRGTARECEGCHADVHLGQFRLSKPVKKCSACHDTNRFKIKTFDHDKLAGYALEGRHAQLQCAKCHAKASVGGKTAARYRLGYSACRDCHADPHAEEGS
ncbi:MAG: cytochrome c3 family protein [Polyangiaceae bacterium]